MTDVKVTLKEGRPNQFFELVEQAVHNVAYHGIPEMVEMETSAGLIFVMVCKSQIAKPIKIKKAKFK